MTEGRILRTFLGMITVCWEGGRLQRISLPGTFDSVSIRKTDPPELVREVLVYLERYFKGEAKETFGLIDAVLDQSDILGFRREVMTAVSRISFGKTKSYSEVAKIAGSPRAARAVGNILAANDFPIIVPCHRVIESSGKIGQFRGGYLMKKALLSFESRMVE